MKLIITVICSLFTQVCVSNTPENTAATTTIDLLHEYERCEFKGMKTHDTHVAFNTPPLPPAGHGFIFMFGMLRFPSWDSCCCLCCYGIRTPPPAPDSCNVPVFLCLYISLLPKESDSDPEDEVTPPPPTTTTTTIHTHVSSSDFHCVQRVICHMHVQCVCVFIFVH